MITYKDLKKNTGRLAVGYASIGHYKPIDTTPKISNIPVGYFSIGNRPEVIINKQLGESRDTIVADIIQEWIYDNGFDKDEYDADPKKFDLQIAMGKHPDRHNIKLNRQGDDLEAYYHSFNAYKKRNDFGLYTSDSRPLNRHLINHHLQDNYEEDNFLKNHVDIIDKHLDNYSNPAPRTFHVYTGVGDTLNIAHIREVNARQQSNTDRMYLPAYTSTSLDPTKAEEFTNNYRKTDENDVPILSKPHREIIRFEIGRGSTHGTYLGSTGFDGGDGHEHEFLLHRGTHIQFLGKPRVYPILSSGIGNVIVHDARIIKQVRKPL